MEKPRILGQKFGSQTPTLNCETVLQMPCCVRQTSIIPIGRWILSFTLVLSFIDPSHTAHIKYLWFFFLFFILIL